MFATQVLPANHPKRRASEKESITESQIRWCLPPLSPTNQGRSTRRTSQSTSSTDSKDSFSFQSRSASITSANTCPKDTTTTTGMGSHCNCTFEDSDVDMVIEDVLSEGDNMSMAPAAPPKKKVKKQDPESKPALTPKIPKILPRPFPPLEQPKVKPMSKAVKEFDTDQFLQKLCGTPVTISLAEILGSSPTIAKKMQDYMRIT